VFEVADELAVTPTTFNVKGFNEERLRVAAGGEAVRVIELKPGQRIKNYELRITN
jgi:hypothetical protein